MTDDLEKSVTQYSGLLRRWSQRKLARRNGCHSEAQPKSAPSTDYSGQDGNRNKPSIVKQASSVTQASSVAPHASHKPPPQDGGQPVGIPDIESLGQDSNLEEFFSEQVCDALRKSALRKVFRFGKFNVCDGLDDYAEDYTNFEPLGNLITADLRLRLERERVAALAALDEAQTEPQVDSQVEARIEQQDFTDANEVPNQDTDYQGMGDNTGQYLTGQNLGAVDDESIKNNQS